MPTDSGMYTDEIGPLPPPEPPPVIFTPEKLIRRTFLVDKQEDGEKFRGQIVEHIEDSRESHKYQPHNFGR
jgi:hypothetical protein